MLEFFTLHWAEIVLSLITAGLLAFCRHIWKQLKVYREMLAERDRKELEQMVDNKIEPLVQDIEELRTYIRETRDIEKSHMKLIIASYRYRLIQLCKAYLRQGYMTGDQFE